MTNIVNYCKNPSFEVNVTDDWTHGGVGTVTQDATYYTVGTKSAKLHAGATLCNLYTITGVSVPNGATVTVQTWMRCSADPTGNKAYLQIYDTTASLSRAIVYATAAGQGAWEYLTTSWTNATGGAKTCWLANYNEFNDSAADVWVDACQLELAAAASPYTDGAQGEGHSWGGAAHNSVSTWTEPVSQGSVGLSPYMMV